MNNKERLPEPQPKKEQKPDVTSVSPACTKPHVMGSFIWFVCQGRIQYTSVIQHCQNSLTYIGLQSSR